MDRGQDPQFEMVREYLVWGFEDGRERSCSLDTFDKAEVVRLNGHPDLPRWKPNRRRRVKFAVAVYRNIIDSRGNTVRYRISTLDNIASCAEVHTVDEALLDLAEQLFDIFK